MKITKYEHSCMEVEAGGKRLLIDPGVATTSVPNYDNITAVVVTHVHADHYDLSKLEEIYAKNPELTLYTVQAVANEIGDKIPTQIVTGGQKATIQTFELEFFGGQHAVIHRDTPVTDNVAVLINSSIYITGDSLTLPEAPVDILAVPLTAPWLKIAEVMDFIAAVKPKRVFAVHDALLSDFGYTVNENWIKKACLTVSADYLQLKPGGSISV